MLLVLGSNVLVILQTPTISVKYVLYYKIVIIAGKSFFEKNILSQVQMLLDFSVINLCF